MRELSLHILDLVQNSIEAGATKVEVSIAENRKQDELLIRICDNGRGMTEAMMQKVLDPFVTTKKTRRIGLGLPLIQMSTQRCDGYLHIHSEPGMGTCVEAMYRHSHLDRPPLGKITETIKAIIFANPELNFTYSHVVDSRSFSLATKDITEILGDIPLTHPDVIEWLTEYLSSSITYMYGGAHNENN